MRDLNPVLLNMYKALQINTKPLCEYGDEYFSKYITEIKIKEGYSVSNLMSPLVTLLFLV